MSWEDIMRRVLPPIGGVSPHSTSAYGIPRKKGTSPHVGVDFNYDVGFPGQTGINLNHPALRAPVAGIVTTNPREGTVGRVAIRDANGFSHEILHTHTQFLAKGDPVAAGQLIGTMGNAGVDRANIEAGAHHVHYQLKDPAGNIVNPTAFWDQQGPVDPNPSPLAHLQEYQQYLQQLGVSADNGFGNAPGVAGVSAAPFVQPNEVRPVGRSESLSDRFGNWASVPVSIAPPTAPDHPESFSNRFGNWGSVPTDRSDDANSPLLRALEKYGRSAAPDGPTSVAAAPSLVPNNVSESGSQRADELYAARERAARFLAGVGGYIENSLTSSAQAASPSPPLYGSPTTDADGSPPPPPVRRLVGVRVDDPRASAFDNGAPAAPSPSNGLLASDRGDSFGDRFGNWNSGDTPQPSQDSTPSYSEMFHQYLNQLAAGQSQAPASSLDSSAPTPYQSVPPMFAPPDYSAAAGNGSIEKWIASLTGIDLDDPAQFQAPPMFSPFYRR